ncbi:MAG: transposase [Actinobacteria bacterium]|nr:transposase [Actinomycetota bacterium]MCA1738445.1 transposase [Actinomycetota bacterium]
MEPPNALRAFRHSLYECLYCRSDALFELADAILTADGAAPSPAHLSLQVSHRRRWGSLYAALRRGRIDAEALRRLLARHPLAGAEGEVPVYAVDTSVWARCDAETSPERGYYYHPSRHSAGQPIVAGWAYQFVAQLNFVRESWTAPVDVERVRPAQDANVVAAGQVKVLLGRLQEEEEEEEEQEAAIPLFVFDAGYDPVKLQRGLEGSPCQILVRLRAGRRFYGDPGLCDPPAHVGRPRRHGPKMKCNDPSTWPEPSAEYACEDAGYGSVYVRAWAELHPKVQNHEGRGSRGPLPIVVGTLVLVEVERLPRGESRREPRVLWLWWHGPEGTTPDLDLIWRSYVRRFDLEHTFRFLKQSMGWTTPRVRHPEQADRWTWLVVAAFSQLRLSRMCVADLRLPWERRYDAGRLTPIRVHRAVSALLAHLGTPAKPPKPCGRSPGRPKGRLSGRAKRYPALKRSA